MLKLTRLIVLIAVALLAARPAMACCASGHDTVPDQEIAAEDTSCQGKGGMAAHTTHAPDEAPAEPASHTDDCPGCSICTTAMAHAQTFDDARVLVQAQSDAPVAVLAARANDTRFKAVPLKTGGPPGTLPRRHDTPITLKQRLLV